MVNNIIKNIRCWKVVKIILSQRRWICRFGYFYNLYLCRCCSTRSTTTQKLGRSSTQKFEDKKRREKIKRLLRNKPACRRKQLKNRECHLLDCCCPLYLLCWSICRNCSGNVKDNWKQIKKYAFKPQKVALRQIKLRSPKVLQNNNI